MSHKENLRAYIRRLANADESEETFKDLFNRGVELLDVQDSEAAKAFGISRPTVTRWKKGYNAPLPGMRKPVYAWMTQRAKQHLLEE